MSEPGSFSPVSPAPPEVPSLRPYPTKLFVESSSFCNLGCAMCVKQTQQQCQSEGNLTAEIFARLEPAFPTLEALILNGIGEPLLNPGLEDFVARARELMPKTGWIGFQTNGLMLNHDRAVALVKAGLDKICISLDAVSPETFRKVREGGEVKDMEQAFAALAQAKERYRASRLEIGIEFVVLRDTIHELPAVLRWAAQRGARFAIVTQVVPYDLAHVEQVSYDASTDEAVTIFAEWEEKARQEGIAIHRYPEVLWKYSKSPAEQEIVTFVNRMKQQALERNVFLNVEKLLGRDTAWFETAERVFAEAREVAAATGIDLRLPALVPRQERRCEFVEGGGAFVSWEGKVHPCYFLWHSYRCFVQQWEQPVKPRVFGNLRERDILEIWNDAEFRSFRESVLSYDYPLCFSCKLAPCDYVQTEQFEQDCHIKGEPCGSCLWCMGVFQCLQ